MGNHDKWTTPKQIKIEREGEPRGTRRGNRKRNERVKGKKARLDEVLSARNSARRYFEYMENDKKRRIEHPEWYTHIEGSRFKRYDPLYQKWYQREFDRHAKLLEKCIADGVISFDESSEFLV